MSRLFKKKRQPTRREIVARRQLARQQASEPAPEAYRRSSNLTRRGSVAKASGTPAEDSERMNARKLIERRRRLSRYAAITSFGALAVVFLLFQLVVNINVLVPDSTKVGDLARYENSMIQYYKARPIERLRFLTDYEALHKHLLESVPEVKNARLEGRGLLTSNLKITFRDAVAQWTSGDKTYFVDDGGVTFTRSYGSVPTVIVRDESGVTAEAGQEVINRQFLGFLGQAVGLFAKEGLLVSEATLPPDTVRQIMFSLHDRPYKIKMTTDRGAKSQVAEAKKAIDYITNRGVSPQYIDVRVDQRVFYKIGPISGGRG